MAKHSYIVMEYCEEFEQALTLRRGGKYPDAGVLVWGEPVAIFSSALEARAAIKRTEHYRLAFEDGVMPAAKNCKLKKAAATHARREDQ